MYPNTAPPRNTASASTVQPSASAFSFRYRAWRISSTAWLKGLTAQIACSSSPASCIFHRGYRAVDRKKVGKMTKFITPAKFSSCRMAEDSSIPSAPSISPLTTSAGSTVT